MKSFATIHEPGHDPGWKERWEAQLQRFFDLPADISDKVMKEYSASWPITSPGDPLTDVMRRAIDKYIGEQGASISDAADEYEETIKAIEVYESIKNG